MDLEAKLKSLAQAAEKREGGLGRAQVRMDLSGWSAI